MPLTFEELPHLACFFVVLVIETRACMYWASALSLVTSPACHLPFCQCPYHFTSPLTLRRGFHFFILLSVIMIFCILTSTVLGDLRWSEFMYKNVYFKIDMPRGVWVSVVTLSTLQSQLLVGMGKKMRWRIT